MWLQLISCKSYANQAKTTPSCPDLSNLLQDVQNYRFAVFEQNAKIPPKMPQYRPNVLILWKVDVSHLQDEIC